MGDFYEDQSDWIMIVSIIFGVIIALSFVVTLMCYCCACCALYKRRNNIGQGMGQARVWGRNQVILVPATQGGEHQPGYPGYNVQYIPEQPPPYSKDLNQGQVPPYSQAPYSAQAPYPSQPSYPSQSQYPTQPPYPSQPPYPTHSMPYPGQPGVNYASPPTTSPDTRPQASAY